ncbi:MAG: serine/threonine protein kinase [Bdellovibrionales bacterium]|nr:serine/threonine protein kinase [Bdellovibrionales bacterium]
MDQQHSSSFYELTPERILDAVERSGVRTTGRCLQLNSMENRVYEIEIECADEQLPPSASERFRVVKFYRPGRWSNAQIRDEHEFLAELAREEIAVVPPEPFPDGSTLQTDSETGIRYAMFPKQGGRLSFELNDDDLARIGRLLARLHLVGARKEAENRIELTTETYALDSLDYLLENQFLPENIEGYYTDTVEHICDIAEPWFAEADMQRIHGDCHVGNILWATAGPRLIDFDDMVMGPCVQDLWLLTPGRGDEVLKARETLLSGYEQFRNFDRSTLRLIEPLRALRMVHFSAWIAKRFDDPSFANAFPDFGSDSYWREELQALLEVLEILHGV